MLTCLGAEFDELLFRHGVGVGVEADDLEEVALVLAPDQSLQRECHFLGGSVLAEARHAARHVKQQDRRTRCLVFGVVHHQVVFGDLNWRAAALPRECVPQRLLHIQVGNRIAKLVGLGLFLNRLASTAEFRFMLAE